MMFRSVVTFLTTLIASFTHRKALSFYLRKVAAALLLFQVISFGAIFVHMTTSIHVHSPLTGEVIHMTAHHQVNEADEHSLVHLPVSDTDEDKCELFNKMLRPTLSQAIITQSLPNDTIVISSELIARKLDVVYRSTRLLQQAPKNSPPCTIS